MLTPHIRLPLEQYPYLTWGKRLPDPVPSDLYLAFGEYIKYSLQSIAYSLNSIWGGVDEPTVPTLNVIAGTGLTEIANQQVGGSFRVLYLKALEQIRKEDILFNSTVAAASRTSSHGIRLVARDGSGGNTTVVAKQLLVTIPTLAENMAPFDLDVRERGIFGTLSAVGFWIAVFRVPGLVPNVQYAHATTYRPYNMSAEFGLYRLLPTPVKDLYTGFFNGHYDMTDDEAVSMAVKSLTAVAQAVTGAAVLPDDQLPSLVVWKRVTPWRPVMTADAIKNRTWDQMYALQAHRNTWYNSMLFTPGGPQLWNYTETVLLPQILAACGK
ncbi:amine oxidase- flavin-containing superfamily [Apiospora saccharicola]|uniref:Amine oxidase- flavin-containing superfamily n=1 Tax=Apiospora saccharicola TaxID=335842 RepID=A0ABR1UN78_9PEZI